MSIFLSLFFACQAGIAQSFTLYYRDIPRAEDMILVRTGTSDTMELTTFLTIRNGATTEKQIQAKKTEMSMFPGTACSLCWAGHCYPSEVSMTEYPLVLAADSTETSCFAHFITGGTVGTSIVRWTYFDKDNPADSVSVVIQYITYPTGIGNPEANHRVHVSPNPADREVFFRLQDPASSEFTIFFHNLSGQPVLHETITRPDGLLKFETSELRAGIYLYSLHS